MKKFLFLAFLIPCLVKAQLILPDGVYKFKLVGSSKYLQMQNIISNNNIWPVMLWEANNTDDQKWTIYRFPNTDYYNISTANLNMNSLEANDSITKVGAKKNGANVQVQQYNQKTNQRWKFKDLGNNQVAIIVESTGQLLDAGYNTMNNNGGLIQVWDEVLNVNQKWVAELVSLTESAKAKPASRTNGGADRRLPSKAGKVVVPVVNQPTQQPKPAPPPAGATAPLLAKPMSDFVADGLYKLSLPNDIHFLAANELNIKDNGGSINIIPFGLQFNQDWQIEKVKDGYKIYIDGPLNIGKRYLKADNLNAASNANEDYINPIVWDNDETDASVWIFKRINIDNFQIINFSNGLYLSQDPNIKSITRLYKKAETEGLNQTWHFNKQNFTYNQDRSYQFEIISVKCIKTTFTEKSGLDLGFDKQVINYQPKNMDYDYLKSAKFVPMISISLLKEGQTREVYSAATLKNVPFNSKFDFTRLQFEEFDASIIIDGITNDIIRYKGDINITTNDIGIIPKNVILQFADGEDKFEITIRITRL